MIAINKCIGLLANGLPVFASHKSEPPELTYGSGVEHRTHWADMVVVEFEHFGFNVDGLAAFMHGLTDGPEPSFKLPTIIATLPVNGNNVEEVLYNAWQVRHVLSTGVHGLMLANASDVGAVRTYVAAARFSFNQYAEYDLPRGLRGVGGEGRPAARWGVSLEHYHRQAEPWPLVPDGQLLLGIKIEHKDSLSRAHAIASVPGVGFAEWGPSDMLASLGRPGESEPPYPKEASNALKTVKHALDKADVAFHCGWPDPSLSPCEQVDYLIDVIGARLLVVDSKAQADYGRGRV